MMVKEEKKLRKETWLEFPPWEHVYYKDQIEEYFQIVRRLSNVGLNFKRKIRSCLVTKAHIVEIFCLGSESLKTTNPHLHHDTNKRAYEALLVGIWHN